LIQHSPFRFALPATQFSLPQTGQGYFPDAGLTHFLSRLENKVGTYLALTGAPLSGPDLVHSGIANFYMLADGKDNLVDLMEGNDGHHASMREYVSMVNDNVWMEEPFSLEPHLGAIERCFNQPTIEAIMEALQAEKSSWANMALDHLLKKCPLSLKVTLHALQLGPHLPLEEALKNDFRVGRALMSTPEYLGGVRAFAARDSSHRWPRTLRDIRETDVKALFGQDPKRADLQLPFEDYHDPYEINWSLEARKRYKQSQVEQGLSTNLPNVLDDIERS
jgi:enoyl-CoA hydratase/carnithine racemase